MVAWPHGVSQLPKNITVIAGKRGLTVAPTRLVDVGSSDEDDPPRIVPGTHCLDDGHGQTHGYLALSYCNGSTPDRPPWQLTTHTKTKFEERLPQSLFPQTFCDAIDWTRKLGERFIWIDNLCIPAIQYDLQGPICGLYIKLKRRCDFP